MLFDAIQASRSLAVINVQRNSFVRSAEAHGNKMADTAAKSATSHKVTEILLTKTSSISSLPPLFHLHQRLTKAQSSSPEVERGTWIRKGCSFSSLQYLWIGPQMTTPFSLIASKRKFWHSVIVWAIRTLKNCPMGKTVFLEYLPYYYPSYIPNM